MNRYIKNRDRFIIPMAHLCPYPGTPTYALCYVYLDNLVATDVKFASRIVGEKALSARNISLKNINTNTISDKLHIHEKVVNFSVDE